MNIDKIREALDSIVADVIDESGQGKASIPLNTFRKIIVALNELDKPAEPVAWMSIGGEVIPAMAKAAWNKRKDLDREANPGDYYTIPLYANPPQAAGLTVDEVIKCVDDEAWTARDRIEDDPMSGITDHITKMVSGIHARLTAAIQAKS